MGIIGGGAHAEFVTVHQDALAVVPPNLDWPTAGGVPEVFMTAHDALKQAGFKPGENVLVHAVGSGVGLAATQLVDSVFPLEKVQDAHRRLESNETFGKVVLTVW
jgi:NADPH:quinone reductase-like Zn-dependent oxidoreductase